MILLDLRVQSPSLFVTIEKYFESGPEVILLPYLPESCREDEITYESIASCPPDYRDRMFYGLNKIVALRNVKDNICKLFRNFKKLNVRPEMFDKTPG